MRVARLLDERVKRNPTSEFARRSPGCKDGETARELGAKGESEDVADSQTARY